MRGNISKFAFVHAKTLKMLARNKPLLLSNYEFDYRKKNNQTYLKPNGNLIRIELASTLLLVSFVY